MKNSPNTIAGCYYCIHSCLSSWAHTNKMTTQHKKISLLWNTREGRVCLLYKMMRECMCAFCTHGNMTAVKNESHVLVTYNIIIVQRLKRNKRRRKKTTRKMLLSMVKHHSDFHSFDTVMVSESNKYIYIKMSCFQTNRTGIFDHWKLVWIAVFFFFFAVKFWCNAFQEELHFACKSWFNYLHANVNREIGYLLRFLQFKTIDNST